MSSWVDLILAALAIWGWASPAGITVQVDEAWAEPSVVARADISDEPGFCAIRLNPQIANFRPPVDYEKLITHEVGHCLWLRHIEGPGIMTRYYEDFAEFSGYDRAEFWHVYPAPHRTPIAMVAAP